MSVAATVMISNSLRASKEEKLKMHLGSEEKWEKHATTLPVSEPQGPWEWRDCLSEDSAVVTAAHWSHLFRINCLKLFLVALKFYL